MNKTDLINGKAYPYGAYVTQEGIQFCVACPGDCKLYLRIYSSDGRILYNINMNDHTIEGCIRSVFIKGLKAEGISYTYVKDGEPVRDPYTMRLRSRRRWGDHKNILKHEMAMPYDQEYDWEGDAPLRLPYDRVIGYMLHVRGFTRHSSSGVKAKGTFMGIIEKIPYLKELGITQIELMPAYDFNECDKVRDYRSGALDEKGNFTEDEYRINYWGFKAGYYFVPKPQYTYSDDSVTEFKDLVKALHAAGIEIVMQFYFPARVNRNLIANCLRFWRLEYHVDGFHIYGGNLPLDVLATDPMISNAKIYYERYEASGIYGGDTTCINESLAEYNQDYAVDIRRFLKSDEDMLHKFVYRLRCNPDRIKVINHLTSYDGFTLNDLVSYDYKHNEANGEDNKDGSSYNYSWNCGIEGATRKNAILRLRMKQLKNAFTMLLLSQGPPMFMAGDEFMNSQGGNNNPYCQDNEVTWLNWKMNKRSTELFTYVKELIALRKAHGILHMDKEASLLDTRSCGYPDISYHAEQAWYPGMDTHIRHIGVLLCGEYAEGGKDDYFYIAVNMHWEDHTFALPNLPAGLTFKYLTDTEGRGEESYKTETDDNGNKLMRVGARTILVLISKKEKDRKKPVKGKGKKGGKR
ncbi:MAG: hypothetical protein K5857_11060 [Lachnospiraceae bacterium]|nr:hypothetical protein [Lachnospiraceae bacterium]